MRRVLLRALALLANSRGVAGDVHVLARRRGRGWSKVKDRIGRRG